MVTVGYKIHILVSNLFFLNIIVYDKMLRNHDRGKIDLRAFLQNYL